MLYTGVNNTLWRQYEYDLTNIKFAMTTKETFLFIFTIHICTSFAMTCDKNVFNIS